MATKRKSKAMPMPEGELGVSGLRQFSGYLSEEFERKLQGRRGMEAYRAMRDNSPAVGAALHAIAMTVRAAKVDVVPFSRDKEDEQRAEFLESCLRDMSFPWPETRAEHFTMLPYGYALSEIVYKRREGYSEDGSKSSRYNDGLIGWAKVALRAQESILRWDIDPSGGIKGACQLAPTDWRERYIPIQKALLFRVSKERNNPEGRSLLRNAYWSWYCSKRLTEIMLIGAERDLQGLAVVRVPGRLMSPTAPPEEKATFEAYKDLARNVRRGEQEGVVLPSDQTDGGQHYHYDLQLLASGGKRDFNVPEMVSMFDRWIATVLLADLLLMGHEAVGSYALAKGKTGLFETSLNGYLGVIDDTYNQHAVPRLWLLNGWPLERLARIRHKPIKARDLAALADFLSKLKSAGAAIFPDRRLEDSLREEAELPATPEPTEEAPAPKAKPPAEEPTDTPDDQADEA